ncbi:MAG: hypothetical protein Q4D02_00310 [Clostridia bacterium]|nr:hypothetical protein [Clostridia bacterium]
MGNYYEGKLTFVLKKEIDDSILNDLQLLCDWNTHKLEEFSEYFRKTKLSKHREAQSLGVQINYLISENENMLDEVSLIECQHYEEYAKAKGKMGAAITKLGYYVVVRLNTKYYRSDGDLGEFICEYFKPFIDTQLYDMTDGGYIGMVEDEDGTYKRSFYIDEKPLKEKLRSIEYLCKGCEQNIHKNYICEYVTLCKRAYDLGRKSIE